MGGGGGEEKGRGRARSEIRGKTNGVCVRSSTKGQSAQPKIADLYHLGRPHNRIEAATTKEIVTPERAGTRE